MLPMGDVALLCCFVWHIALRSMISTEFMGKFFDRSVTEITKPEWTQLVIPSVYVLLNITWWHQSSTVASLIQGWPRVACLDNFVFMAPCVRMAPSTPGSRRESPQKWKEWSTTSIILQKGAFLIPPPLPPPAGGLSELPDRKHAASIHAKKGNERSSAISNVGVATICLVFFNLQPRALLRLKKSEQKNRGQAKIEFSQQQLSFLDFLSHQSSSLTC